MTKIFIDRPVATAMFFLAVLALGVYSFLNTPLELAPKENFPQASIQTGWPGVPPEIIQSQITAPLEAIVAEVKGVRKISSESQIGMSRITLEFAPDTNMEFANLALREGIAKLGRTLPYGVRPAVHPFVPEDFRVRPFLSYSISGGASLQKLRELVKDRIEFGIGAVRGVSRVTVSGGSEPELRIVLDKKMLKAYGVHPRQVDFALSQRLRTYPTGRVRKGTQEYLFKVADPIRDAREIGETIIAHSGANPLKLGDLARIVPSYGDIQAINRINGLPTVRLEIAKEKGANSLRVARDAKARLALIQKELPADIVFKAIDDESGEIRKNLRELYRLAGIITVVVFAMILIVLRSIKPSILILSSIVFSIVITFNLIYLLKISMNMLTLGALALGFGMFVDNSIVVFENTLRLREQGCPPVEAAVRGAREVFVAVLASTLTTMCVFFCFPYFQGRLRIYYLPLAFVISSALAASLLVSYTLIPALSLGLIKNVKRRLQARPSSARRAFEGVLAAAIRHPIAVVLLVAALLVGSYKWFRSEVTLGEFFSWYSKQQLYVHIGVPPGTGIEKTDEVIRSFEAKALEDDAEKEVNTSVFENRAYILITFPPAVENSYRPYVLKEELIRLATQYAGIDVGIYGFDPQGYWSSMGTGTFYDSNIRFFGYNLKKLKDITADVERTLRKNPRIKDVRTTSSRWGWWRTDSFEYILKIDKDKLRRHDIEPVYLYAHLQTLIRGTFGIPLRATIGGNETVLSVKFPEADEMDLKALQESLIDTGRGESVRVGDITSLEERPIAGSIDRENQQFQQTVQWEFRGPSKASENFRKAVFRNLRLPPGFSAKMDEDWRITKEEKGQLKFAVILSLILIFMILAALYESFLHPFWVMMAVPLELIGVFVAFVVSGYAFDSSAYIGVILLGGIVVNNAILLVNHINLKRRQGLGLLEGVLAGARERVRPILMTTSTTVFGILPMLLIKMEVGQRQIWSSLALCTAGGLVSSTLLLLFVVPILYYHGEGLRSWAAGKVRELGAFRESWTSQDKRSGRNPW